jgi:hypothetical protein
MSIVTFKALWQALRDFTAKNPWWIILPGGIGVFFGYISDWGKNSILSLIIGLLFLTFSALTLMFSAFHIAEPEIPKTFTGDATLPDTNLLDEVKNPLEFE